MFGLFLRSQRLKYVYLLIGKMQWSVRGRRNRMGAWDGWGEGFKADRMLSVGQAEYPFPELRRNVKVDIPYFDN